MSDYISDVIAQTNKDLLAAYGAKRMSDYISRDWLSNAVHNFFKGLNHNVTEEDIQAYINAVPSADVRVNIHGEWIKIQSGDKDFPESIVCSKCKNENSHLDFNEHGEPIGKVFVTSKFCPNCGADMRGGK